MAEKTSALHSVYIIDGVTQEFTPAQLLDAQTVGVSVREQAAPSEGVIVDETLDPVFRSYDLDPGRTDEYLDAVLSAKRVFPLAHPDSFTRMKMAESLLESIWKEGHFRLGDLQVSASWKWNSSQVGSMAAFYRSVQASTDYIDSLGLSFRGCRYSDSGRCEVLFSTSLSDDADDEDYGYVSEPFRSEHPTLSSRRSCPSSFEKDPQSWVIYIPFDSSDYRLGGSLLAQTCGIGGGADPQISDADYFIDCYEVVRELVEDGIVIAGATVGDGGLLRTLSSMSGARVGLDADISGILKSYQEKNPLRVLFSEIPGVVIQIRDADFDYIDAELLLQDVAYFPLGHPVPGSRDIHVKASAKSGIQTILESLMQNAEGED